MDTTRVQQQALDDELVAPADRLKIGKCNLRLSSTLKSKEPTLQVVLDALKLTPFYNAFEISADVPEVYMQEFWVTVSRHHSSLRFKLNSKSHTVIVDNFRDMLKIWPKLPETSMDKGLTVLSDVALIEAEQLKLVIERRKIQTHSSHASGSGVDEGTGDIPRVPDVPTYKSDDEQISWKSSEEDDEDEVNISEKDDDNDNNDDDDDFSTHDDEAMQEEVNEEDSFDPRVQTPSHVESTDDESNEESDKEVQGTNTEEEKMVEEATHKEDEANELYRDINVNLEGKDTVMTDAPLPNVQATQETEDTHLILTALINPEGQHQSSFVSYGFVSNMLNPRPNTCIDLIFNTKATSLVDIPVTTIAEPPLVFATTLPPPPTPLITHMQQTPFPIPTTTPSADEGTGDIPGVLDVPIYRSNDEQISWKSSEEDDEDEVNAAHEEDEANELCRDVNVNLEGRDTVNSGVLLCHLASYLTCSTPDQIHEQVKEQVKAQVSKILPKIKKTLNEQLEAEVMTRSSTESKTSLDIAANLSELELKKILIEKIESNKSINISNEQKNLYKALVEAYESDKLILDTYGNTVSFKRRRDDEDKDEEPSAGSNRGSKRRRSGKEPESTSAPKEKTSKITGKSTDGSKSQHKSAGATEEQSDEETSQHPDWFQKLAKIPSPNHDWNKTLSVVHDPV
ncbi:hypothetical protein Tco_1052078 [Tanacetum coccineum]